MTKENKTEKKKLIPELRFPEFKNDENWKEDELGKLLIKNTNKNKNLKYSLVQSVSNKLGFVDQSEYFTNRKIASQDTSNYYVIKKGYFAYNPSRIDVGSLAYKNDNNISIISPLYVSFKANNNKLEDIYLLNYFNTNLFKRQMVFEGGVRNTLSYDNLIKIKIFYPKLLEQKKIASFLSNLDELIEAHKKKLELLKTQKKGLMQNLFPQEGEKVPKLRFPEFKNDGEWEEVLLLDIVEQIKRKVGTKKLIPVSISAGVGFIPQKEKFGRDISGNQYRNYIILKKGEFAYNKGNSKKFPQGCIYRLKEFDEVAAPNAFICFNFRNTVVPDFFQGYFDNNYHGRQLQKFITSGARMDGLLNISSTDFFSIKFYIPKSIDEQQKIASFLSNLDELIDAQKRKLEELERQKKGVMQKIFPSTV